MVKESLSALLVHNQEEPLRALGVVLESQGIRTCRANSCYELLRLLLSDSLPRIVFTDTELPDGTWTDVVSLAEKASDPPPVIVVSRVADVHLYIATMDGGAFDFVVPPFANAEISYIVRSAELSASSPAKSSERPAACAAKATAGGSWRRDGVAG